MTIWHLCRRSIHNLLHKRWNRNSRCEIKTVQSAQTLFSVLNVIWCVNMRWTMHFLMTDVCSDYFLSVGSVRSLWDTWLVLLFFFFCRQSLDSSCDIVCLKERIQKSQEEREKREERLLQTQTLQQTGNPLGRRAAETHKQTTEMFTLVLMLISRALDLGHMVWNLSNYHSSATLTDALCLPPLHLLLLSSCLFLDMEEEEEMICFADPTRFITDPDFCYQEFARREEDHFQVFRVQVRTICDCISCQYTGWPHNGTQTSSRF